jgi:hypothetical protein
MEDRDPRAVLGLPLDATRGEAQRAFRRLAKQTHPDAGGEAAAFRAVAGAWADHAPVLPADPPPVAADTAAPHRPVTPDAAVVAFRASARSPHVRAYRPAPSRVVWAEPRPSAPSSSHRRTGRAGRAGPEFAAVLNAEMARLAG